MLRITFTLPDLARVRLVTARAPAETVFAMDLLGRGGGGRLFDRWRHVVERRLGPRARGITAVVQSIRLRPSLFTADDPYEARALPVDLQEPGLRDVAGMMHRFYRVGLAPYWRRLHSYLESDRESRGRIVLSSGVEGLLTTLHPQIKWRPPTLEIAQPNGWTQDIQLDGRGLVIVSSVFLSSTPRLFVDAHSRDHSPVLAYPTPLDIMSAMALWDPRLCNDRALGALVGRTRAAILEALTETYTTSQLGRKVGVSAAAASQHTAVLREAGLIMTRRKQNKVLHTVTGLGSALIKGNDLGEKGVVAPA